MAKYAVAILFAHIALRAPQAACLFIPFTLKLGYLAYLDKHHCLPNDAINCLDLKNTSLWLSPVDVSMVFSSCEFFALAGFLFGVLEGGIKYGYHSACEARNLTEVPSTHSLKMTGLSLTLLIAALMQLVFILPMPLWSLLLWNALDESQYGSKSDCANTHSKDCITDFSKLISATYLIAITRYQVLSVAAGLIAGLLGGVLVSWERDIRGSHFLRNFFLTTSHYEGQAQQPLLATA